jgi:thioesterase domain-containing protein
VRLMARIERDLGRRLPLAALFRGSTLASLAAAVREAGVSPPAPPLVLLQEGTGRPSFWFHPLDGLALCYAELARRLPGHTLYGLESSDEAASLRDLAVRHAEAILRVQPRGPCLLGGWSFGGLVAWETARVLEGLGLEVGSLVLVDSRPPGATSPEPDDATLDAFLRAEARADEADLPALRAVVRAHLRTLRGYRPEPVACPVTLFLAEDRPGGETADGAAPWRPLTPGGLEVETLPGDHFHLLTGPGVDLLAAKLRAKLAAGEPR